MFFRALLNFVSNIRVINNIEFKYINHNLSQLSQQMPIYLYILKILLGIRKGLSDTFIICGDDMSLYTTKVMENKR